MSVHCHNTDLKKKLDRSLSHHCRKTNAYMFPSASRRKDKYLGPDTAVGKRNYLMIMYVNHLCSVCIKCML